MANKMSLEPCGLDRQFCRIIQIEMADTTDVDFNLSDVSVFSPENDMFVLVVISSLSLLGIYCSHFKHY